jgi:YVTN family beta-propeller protein
MTIAVALVMASIPMASAATLSRSWLATVGSGTAAISANTDGTGALALKLKGLKASTSYPTILYKGACSSVGAKLMTLASFTTTSKGLATKTIALTSSQTTAITTATTDGATVAIRVGKGSLVKCGAFVAKPVIVARIGLGDYSFGLAADGTSVWAVNSGDNTVSRINPATNTVVATIPVGVNPDGIASDGTMVWVANEDDNTVSRIDPATNVVTATVSVGIDPTGVAIGGGAVWVANALGNTVSRIDPATNTVTATVPVGMGPARLAFGEGALWVANWLDGSVSRIDPATNTVVASIFVGSVDAVVAGGGGVWVSVWGVPVAANGSVARIDPATNVVSTQVTVGYEPTGMAIIGDSVYVALAGDPSIVQLRAGAVASRIPVGMKSYCVSSGNGSLWVLHPVGSAIGGGRLYAGGLTRVNL